MDNTIGGIDIGFYHLSIVHTNFIANHADLDRGTLHSFSGFQLHHIFRQNLSWNHMIELYIFKLGFIFEQCIERTSW